jgi:hypothetical protein
MDNPNFELIKRAKKQSCYKLPVTCTYNSECGHANDLVIADSQFTTPLYVVTCELWRSIDMTCAKAKHTHDRCRYNASSALLLLQYWLKP